MEVFGYAYKVSLTSKEQKYMKPQIEFVTQEKINLENKELGFGRHLLSVLKTDEESDLYTVSVSVHDEKLKIAKYIDFETAVDMNFST